MTRSQPAHLTLDGQPLCQCEMHYAGLLGPKSPLPAPLQQCSFRSLAEANRAKQEMQKHRSGLKVVRGYCPA